MEQTQKTNLPSTVPITQREQELAKITPKLTNKK
jgi:hypothetical protein